MKIKFETILKLIVPIFIGLGVIFAIGLSLNEEIRAQFFSLVTAYFLPPLGKESIIPIGIGVGLEPLIIALAIAFVDIIVASFIIWNYDFTKKIPVLKNFIKKIEGAGEKSSDKYRWIKPLRFIGIVLFVMIPFQGSGGLVGSIVGRLIGMKEIETLAAISTGAVAGCIIIAYTAESIKMILLDNLTTGIILIILIITIGATVILYRKNKKRRLIKVKIKNSIKTIISLVIFALFIGILIGHFIVPKDVRTQLIKESGDYVRYKELMEDVFYPFNETDTVNATMHGNVLSIVHSVRGGEYDLIYYEVGIDENGFWRYLKQWEAQK